MNGIRARIVARQTVRFEPFTLPDELTGTQVLVKVERSIISAGTELSIYTGLEPDSLVPGNWCSHPWTPGYGGIGRVAAVGPDIPKNPRFSAIVPGQRIYGPLNHSTHFLLDAARQLCVPVPDALDSTVAAFTRMFNVAITAYNRADVSLGDGVVIIGLGLVGNLAGQCFAAAGQRVIGLDISSHRRALARTTGFAGVVDSANLSDEELATRVQELNFGKRPRVVVDAVGDSRLVEKGVRLVANNGQVIILGTPRAPYETDCTSLLKMTHLRGIDIKGALEWIIPLFKEQGPGITTESNAEMIMRLLCEGKLQVEPLCSHVLPPSELNRAYQGLLHEKDSYLGVELDWENYPAPAPSESS